MRSRKVTLVGVLAVSLIGAAGAAFPEPAPTRQPIRPQMTCRDFLRFDDAAKPEVVYWFAARGNRVVDVDATDRMVATVVERCKDAPGAPLSTEVNVEANRLRKQQEAP